MDNSKLPMEKRGKLEKDAQIMIKMLPQQVELEKRMKGASEQKQHSIISSTKLNKSVVFDQSEEVGVNILSILALIYAAFTRDL